MKNRHATELDIQKFTFDQNECESHIIQHIRSCKECKERVENYLSLSTFIKDQPEPSLEYNLSNLVLDQLPPSKETETSYSYLIDFIMFSIVGLLILSLFLFGEAVAYLLDNIQIQQSYFIISIIVLISTVLVFDLFRSFNKKVKMLNS